MSLQVDLASRVALVTGGAKGIGAGITQVLLEAGAMVHTCGRSEVTALEGTTHHVCDVRDATAVEELLAGIGRLDLLVNNAGGSPWGLAADTTPDRHRRIVELNLLSPLLVSQSANSVMQGQDEGGVIVNISSVSGVRPSPGTAAYGAAKAGLDHLTRSLAMEWGPQVRINSIDVGMTRTPALEEFYGEPAKLDELAQVVPRKRLATPRDVGQLVAFLASPLAEHVSGSTIELHGGGEAGEFYRELEEDL